MISNGLVWNKAGDTFYYTDTPTYQVDAFDFDGKTGEISNRRCAIKVPDDTSPDVRTINQAPSYRTIHFAMMTHSCFALLNT